MARRRNTTDLPDWHLWRSVARTVTPLRGKLAVEDEPLPLPSPVQPVAPIIIPRLRTISDAPAPVKSVKKTPGRSEGIEPRMKRRLGRGQIEIDGTIDLHGMRQHEAHAALKRFVTARYARGDRTILVITGKGLKKLGPDAATIIEAGVLRSMLPLWLSEPNLAPLVAGWDVSAQQHGGDGAFYVRLKRSAA
jgi:DNA-nicking Smr family endonuclease